MTLTNSNSNSSSNRARPAAHDTKSVCTCTTLHTLAVRRTIKAGKHDFKILKTLIFEQEPLNYTFSRPIEIVSSHNDRTSL